MINEVDAFGVFLSPVLISASLAVLFSVILRTLLVRLGDYRLVWRPALVDTALFVIVWALAANLSLPKVH